MVQRWRMWRDVGKACGWKHPRAPRIGMLFVDERATLGVLTFLRDTKAGDFVALEALGGEEWWRRRAQWRRSTQCRWM